MFPMYMFSSLGRFDLILVVQCRIVSGRRPQADLPLYAAWRRCVRREDIMYINYIYKCKNGLIKLYLSVDF